MFSLEESMSYFVYTDYVDMRCGVQRLYDLVNTIYPNNSFITGNQVFIFFGASKNNVKILRWESGGFLLYQKKLAHGTFEIPTFDSKLRRMTISYKTLSFIMQGVVLKSVKYRSRLRV